MIELTEDYKINPYLLEAVIVKGNAEDVAFFSNGNTKRLTIPSETPLIDSGLFIKYGDLLINLTKIAKASTLIGDILHIITLSGYSFKVVGDIADLKAALSYYEATAFGLVVPANIFLSINNSKTTGTIQGDGYTYGGPAYIPPTTEGGSSMLYLGDYAKIGYSYTTPVTVPTLLQQGTASLALPTPVFLPEDGPLPSSNLGIDNTTAGIIGTSDTTGGLLAIALSQCSSQTVINSINYSGNHGPGIQIMVVIGKDPLYLEAVMFLVQEAGVTISQSILPINPYTITSVRYTVSGGVVAFYDQADNLIATYTSLDTTTAFNLTLVMLPISAPSTNFSIPFEVTGLSAVNVAPPSNAADLAGIVKATTAGTIGSSNFEVGDYLMFYSGVTECIVIPKDTKIANTIAAEVLPGGVIDTAVFTAINSVLTPLQQFLVDPIISGVTSTNTPEDFPSGTKYIVPLGDFTGINLPNLYKTILKTVDGGPYEAFEIPDYALVKYQNVQYIFEPTQYATYFVDQDLPSNYALHKPQLKGYKASIGTNYLGFSLIDNSFMVITLSDNFSYTIQAVNFINREPTKAFGKLVIVAQNNINVTFKNTNSQDIETIVLTNGEVAIVDWIYFDNIFLIQEISRPYIEGVIDETQTLNNVLLASPEANILGNTRFVLLTGDVTTLSINRVSNGINKELFITSNYSVPALSIYDATSNTTVGPYNLAAGGFLQFKVTNTKQLVRVG